METIKRTLWTGPTVPPTGYIWIREVNGENIAFEFDEYQGGWIQSDIVTAGGSSVTVENVLTSTSVSNALSANMGKTLNDTKQDNLVSGTNIKTVNSESILGSGDIAIPAGAKGDKGDTGATGAPGTAATVSVGTVTTGAAGTNAIIDNSGTAQAAIFNFTIPRGADGADAYTKASTAGFSGTEDEFYTKLATLLNT